MVRSIIGVVLLLVGTLSLVLVSQYPEMVMEHALGLVQATGAIASALGIALMTQEWRSRTKRQGMLEVIKISRWRPRELQSNDYKADEQIESVDTPIGVAYVQRLRLLSRATDEVAAEISVVTLYEGAYWNQGSHTKLCVGHKRPVVLPEELETDRIVYLLSKVQSVLCLGLVSNAECSEVDAYGVSVNRAHRLADWLTFSSGMVEKNIDIKPVPMGQARTPATLNSHLDCAQRTAVLLGIATPNKLISQEAAYGHLRTLVQIKSVNLEDYPNTVRPKEEVEAKLVLELGAGVSKN